MNLPVIRKTGTEATPPLLVDYEQEAKQFTWSAARAELSGLPGGGLNLAHEAVDRHLHADHGQRVALRWRPATGRPRDLTYAQLADRSSRFANLLNALGIGQGGSVVTLLDRTPEFAGIALGAWKAGAVLCPLPPTLRPEALRACLELGAPRVLITTAAHYRRQVAPIRDALRPRIGTVLLVEPTHTDLPGTDDFLRRMEQAAPRFELVATRGESPAFVWFTHARSGHPTGVQHVHEAAVAIHATGSLALDLRPEDVVWSTADPASPLGLAYGLIAPLTHGATVVLDEGPTIPSGATRCSRASASPSC